MDANNDGIPDAVAGWDANANEKLDSGEISHVNGYYIKPSDWAYKMRYDADKMNKPGLFKDGKMPMSRYVRQLYDAEINPETGYVKWDEKEMEKWEEHLKKHGYKVKKPTSNLSPLSLWRAWVFKPAYDSFVHKGGDWTKGDANLVTIGREKIPLKKIPKFKSMLVSQKAYKMIFTDWLVKQYVEHHGGLTEPQIKKIKDTKEYRDQMKELVLSRLSHLAGAWYEVFEFLCDVLEYIIGLSTADVKKFTFNEDMVHKRYKSLLQEFKANEQTNEELLYTNPYMTYDYNLWRPKGFDPKRKPTEDQKIWGDANRLKNFHRAHEANKDARHWRKMANPNDWGLGTYQSSRDPSRGVSREMSPGPGLSAIESESESEVEGLSPGEVGVDV
jgi:hypothetical protein